MSEDSVRGLFEDLEDELNSQDLERKGKHAVAAARITGLVFTDAVASGVPADLAKDMATDFWAAAMNIPYVVDSASTETELPKLFEGDGD
ncbi:hypothetical protein [Streptomyces sp. CFMR 7]|uniref:hypothetical protein n=1 Tax=Streptomyces sp. CFMR 7 TaxID=1649184 RepID=UPI0011AA7AE8|nr:hypothetical protein [Streptomyces sp. CFMR 7]